MEHLAHLHTLVDLGRFIYEPHHLSLRDAQWMARDACIRMYNLKNQTELLEVDNEVLCLYKTGFTLLILRSLIVSGTVFHWT